MAALLKRIIRRFSQRRPNPLSEPAKSLFVDRRDQRLFVAKWRYGGGMITLPSARLRRSSAAAPSSFCEHLQSSLNQRVGVNPHDDRGFVSGDSTGLLISSPI